MTTSDVPLMKI